jgi:hypothetical protein
MFAPAPSAPVTLSPIAFVRELVERFTAEGDEDGWTYEVHEVTAELGAIFDEDPELRGFRG